MRFYRFRRDPLKSLFSSARIFTRIFALFGVVFSAAASIAASGPFANLPIYPTGGTNQLVVADLNKDGYPDLISFELVGIDTWPVIVQLNNGDGTLGPAVSYAVGQPYDAVVADLNGDGNPDIIVASRTPAAVMVLLGNGDGTFKPAVSYSSPGGAVSLGAGDVNGDGKIDVVASDGQSSISVFLGNGDGTLQTARSSSVSTPGLLVLADFNQDHKLDLAILNSSLDAPGFRILLGNGDGTFQSPVGYTTASSNSDMLTADFNHDGIPDIAIATYDISGTVDIFLGRGDGTFKTAIPANVNLDPAGQLNPVDINGDGNTDLILSSEGGFTVILGNGDGTFQAPTNYSGLPGFYSIAVADFDRDGRFDIATPNYGADASGTVVYGTSIIHGLGDGTFPMPRVYVGGQVTQGTAVGDFNNDGFLDIAYNKGILLGVGDGTFTVGTGFFAGGGPSGLVADFNNDGKLDFAFADDATRGKVYIGLGNGAGGFAKPAAYQVGKKPTTVATGDFNHDGNADLVTADSISGDISILLGKGDGTFLPAITNSSVAPIGVAVGDFNRDGIPDLAVVEYAVTILLGNGDGTFQPPVSYPAYGSRIAVGDFNGDGVLDLLAADGYNGMSVLLGNGDGTFQSPIVNSAVVGSADVAVADFNGDGKLDVVTLDPITSSSSPEMIHVQYGNGDGTFQAPVAYPVGLYAQSIGVGDFNGDGAPDLAVGSDLGIIVELNTRGTFLSTTAAPNPATVQQSVTLTAIISASLRGSPLPSGNVTFMDGSTTLGSGDVVNGVATLVTSFAAAGTHNITPTYSGDANFNPHSGAVVAESVLSPKVNLSSTALSFGTQKVGTTSKAQAVKLTNRGSGALLISTIATSGDYHQTNNCPTSLPANSTCTVSVTFTPAKVGNRPGAVTITDNAANSPQKVSLSGTGN